MIELPAISINILAFGTTAFTAFVVAAELLSGRISNTKRGVIEQLFSELPTCGFELEHWFRVGKNPRSNAMQKIQNKPGSRVIPWKHRYSTS
ncbi:MAG: hypothetical protein JW841_18810 [Deltaproteobacteria bacterium]|nr:hypothetical protein [Deltaproteobacteria bacterium]